MPRILLLALLTLLLASCTGSYEAPSPVLLITTFTRTTEPTNAIGIVRDSLNIGQTDRTRRFTFLPDSFRALPAPPRSFDMTNRATTRNTLVVLSRANAAPATVPESYLSFFTTSPLDGSASDPEVAGFGTSRIDLPLGGAAIVPRNFPNRDAPLYCPSKVQVSQGGNYAAVLNVPRLCGFVGSSSFIDIFDLTGAGRLLQRINNVAEGGLYVSQSSSADILYYATNESGTLEFVRVPLPRPGQAFGPDDTLGTTLPVATVRSQLSQGDFVDLGIAGEAGSERLVVLFRNALAYITGYTGEGTPTGPIRTANADNALVLRDDLLETSETLVLGDADAARLSVFSSTLVTDEDDPEAVERRARVYASVGTIEPNNGYAYFAGTGPTGPSVSLLDLNAYSTGSTPNVQGYDEGLGGLAPADTTWSPAFLTWVQSRPPITP